MSEDLRSMVSDLGKTTKKSDFNWKSKNPKVNGVELEICFFAKGLDSLKFK